MEYPTPVHSYPNRPMQFAGNVTDFLVVGLAPAMSDQWHRWLGALAWPKPGQVAWGICAGCAVHVFELRTGAATTVRVPARNWIYDGTFSSDGRLLAVHISGGVRPDSYATRSRIAVIDLRTRRLRILPGSAVGTDLPEAMIFGWQGGGETLIAAVTGRTVTQIATWRPGAAGLLARKFWFLRA